ncbi:MAG: hypothetical protein IT329_00060 [Caldilineaceae bacterium]|nr:hypothetical protein [Caldilineaceae bacterium]
MKSFATRIAVASTLALSLLASSLGPVYAQAFPSYDSGVQVQNLQGTAGSVTLKSYTEDGTEKTVVAADPITANGSNTYFAATLPLDQGFKGSMVVSADVEVAAIANIVTPGFTAAAAYLAANEGATTVQLPLLMKNNSGYNTWFAVQNTASTEATVDIVYSDGVVINDVVIKPSASKTFYQSQENHPADPQGRSVFSAIITSDQPIVAAVLEETSTLMFAYTGFTGGAKKPVMPLINYQPAIGYQTGVQIQNVGNAATNVTVTYTPAKDPVTNNPIGTTCTETLAIQPGKSETFALRAFAPGDSPGENSTCADGVRFVGAAEVTDNSADQDLTVIVNQTTGVVGGAYGGFDPGSVTAKVVLPLIQDRRGADFQFWTGFNIMNVGNGNTTVTCSYTGSSFTQQATLTPGGVMNALQKDNIADGYAGSGTCTTNPAMSIVGVVNQLSQTNPTMDRLMVSEGANVAAQ